ncbi:MAG: prepilin peptidase [bacterium]
MYYLIFLIGLFIGSFLNVCIYRIPRGDSLVLSRSRCPSCGHVLKWWELMPVISFLILRGKCSECGEKISWYYTLVEIFTAIIFLILYIKFGLTYYFYIYAFLFSVLFVLSGIDLAFGVIPDIITIPMIFIGFVFSLIFNHINFLDSLFGIIAGGGILLLIAYLSKGGMGGGDIKMMAMVGAFTGWEIAITSIFLGAFLGAVNGLILIKISNKDMKSALPFGPYLSLGALISILYYQRILDFYLDLIL